MSQVPGDLRYTESHEWVRTEDDSVVVGITDHAQDALGELVYVELPEVGAHVKQGDAVAVVESVKAASDLYSPVDGEIVEVNQALADSPEKINGGPYDDGWIMRVKPDRMEDLEKLLDPNGYQKTLDDE